jgi:acetolactate synthase regulatory subunit
MMLLWLCFVSLESSRICAETDGLSVIVRRGFSVVMVHRNTQSDALQALVHQDTLGRFSRL